MTPHDQMPGWNQSSLIQGRFHYLRKEDGTEELYDLEVDPWELRDLAPLPRGAATLPRLRATLSSLLGGHAE
jgi:arylsulfatase A-like enzyme